MQSHKYNLIVIGGGAAGIMAAITAKRNSPEYAVAIVDRTFALGRKILVCGAGRCNITNVNLDASTRDHYYGADPEFVAGVFSQFGYQDIVGFFNDMGIELYVERKTNIGKLFPITNQAQTVTALLEDELKALNIDVILNTEVQNISSDNLQFNLKCVRFADQTVQLGENLELVSDYVVLSAGGKTYPALGSNGSGYNLAEALGHKVISPVPSALPLEGKNPLSQALQGTKMEIEATSIIDGERIKTREDDVMFTQYGLSGPAILNISREISIRINREHQQGVEVSLNFFPGKDKVAVKHLMQQRWQKHPQQTLEHSLFGIFPNKIPAVLLKLIGMNKDDISEDITDDQAEALAGKLTDYRIQITGTRGWNEAEFTAGGVDTTQVDPQTLESKLTPHLFLCGEILDVDGDVGGFNLSWAWSSGHLAGQLGGVNELK